MPAGVSWLQYSKYFVAAMVSMTLGSTCVHLYYHPMKDWQGYIELERRKIYQYPEEIEKEKQKEK